MVVPGLLHAAAQAETNRQAAPPVTRPAEEPALSHEEQSSASKGPRQARQGQLVAKILVAGWLLGAAAQAMDSLEQTRETHRPMAAQAIPLQKTWPVAREEYQGEPLSPGYPQARQVYPRLEDT